MDTLGPIRSARQITPTGLIWRAALITGSIAILFVIHLLYSQAVQAQGCGGMNHGSGGHAAAHEQPASSSGEAVTWPNLLTSRAGLKRAVSDMSAEDAKFYGSLLRDDFDLVRKSAGTSYPVLKDPLDAASPRIKRWSKEIEKEIKGRQADAALVAFRRLDVEIQRTIALFPADALPPEIASLYDTADSDVVGEDAGEAQSVGADIPSVYACPMHPEVTSTTPGNCPKCGMNLAKSGQ